MNFMLNDRVKHRLTGLVVVLSFAVIFLPVMMKQSNRHFEENINVSLKLPVKPKQPLVEIPSQQAMFQSVKSAHVILPPKPVDEPKPSFIAKAEPLRIRSSRVLAQLEAPVKRANKVTPALKKIASLPVKKTSTANTNRDAYAVQLASFSQKRNAEYLVNRLRHQGYSATYNTLNTTQGNVFKVIVGALKEKKDAINLQQKLAVNTQLKGFVIKTGVS
jgi:DedD protein